MASKMGQKGEIVDRTKVTMDVNFLTRDEKKPQKFLRLQKEKEPKFEKVRF